MIINIKVIANSKIKKIEKVSENEFKIHLKEKPVEGKANKKLIEILAEHFKCRKSQISIIRGKNSSQKVVSLA